MSDQPESPPEDDDSLRVLLTEQSGDVTLAVEQIQLREVEFNVIRKPGSYNKKKIETKAQISNETLALDDHRHSVALTVEVRRIAEEKEVFDCKVCYFGIFQIQGASAEKCQELLLTRCLDTLYPYVTATITQLSNMAGFRQLQLALINFSALFRNKQREQDKWETDQDKIVHH